MSEEARNEMTSDEQIRAAAAAAAATMYGHYVAVVAKDEDDLYRQTPERMVDDTLRMALAFEGYIRTGTFPDDQRP